MSTFEKYVKERNYATQELVRLENEFIEIWDEKYSVVTLRKSLECLVDEMFKELGGVSRQRGEWTTFPDKIAFIKSKYNKIVNNHFIVETFLDALAAIKRNWNSISDQIHYYGDLNTVSKLNIQALYEDLFSNLITISKNFYDKREANTKYNFYELISTKVSRESEQKILELENKILNSDNEYAREIAEKEKARIEAENKYIIESKKLQNIIFDLKTTINESEKEKESVQKEADKKVCEYELTVSEKEKELKDFETKHNHEIALLREEYRIKLETTGIQINSKFAEMTEKQISENKKIFENQLKSLQLEIDKKERQSKEVSEKLYNEIIRVKNEASVFERTQLNEKNELEKRIVELSKELTDARQQVEKIASTSNLDVLKSNEWKHRIKATINKEVFRLVISRKNMGDYNNIISRLSGSFEKSVDENVKQDIYMKYLTNQGLIESVFKKITKTDATWNHESNSISDIGPYLAYDSNIRFDDEFECNYVFVLMKGENWTKFISNNKVLLSTSYTFVSRQWSLFNAWAKGIKKIKMVYCNMDNTTLWEIEEVNLKDHESVLQNYERLLIGFIMDEVKDES